MAEFKKLINPPIMASEIDSESATSGQVLTADGNGGASWQNVSGGSGGGTTIEGHTVSFNSPINYEGSVAGYVLYLDNNLKPHHAIIPSDFSLTINNVYKIFGLYMANSESGISPNYYNTDVENAIGTPVLISSNGFSYIGNRQNFTTFDNRGVEINLFVFKDCTLTFTFSGGGAGG